jgi:hypothetical protein
MGMEPDAGFEEIARRRAEQKGWEFDRVEGNPSLIRRLVDGEWEEKDFLVVPPGKSILVSHDTGILSAGDSEE